MRKDLLHIGFKELTYEIREIVEVANKIESFGVEISWENIGDPVVKGEKIPEWMKDIIANALKIDIVYGYSPSKGLLETRRYLSKNNEKLGEEDIIFFNGLGEAINKIYGYLAFSARVIGPNPAYPSHSSAEAVNSGSEHLTYTLDPKNDWNPNLEEIENKVKYNPNVTGILVINPDNPTGAVFRRDVLEGIVDIAKRYNLFLIFDEIYEKLHFNSDDKVLLKDIIGDVPGISMKGISKELPWPGARCGWIEIYNRGKDENFSKYIDTIYMSKMLEVCSTTLPQYIIPEVYENPEFKKHIDSRIEKYKNRADLAYEILGDMKEASFIKPKGAFYFSVVFNMENINDKYIPEITNKDLNSYIESIISSKYHFDKNFCYYLLAGKGVCTAPLTSFNSTYNGFRMTLLEENIDKFEKVLKDVRDFILKFAK